MDLIRRMEYLEAKRKLEEGWKEREPTEKDEQELADATTKIFKEGVLVETRIDFSKLSSDNPYQLKSSPETIVQLYELEEFERQSRENLRNDQTLVEQYVY